MPIEIRWEPQHVVARATGEVSAHELALASLAITTDARHRPGTATLLDLRDALLAGIDGEALRRLTVHVAALPDRRGDRTALLVAPGRAADYGKARWWTGLVARADGVTRAVFTSEEQALAWLGVGVALPA